MGPEKLREFLINRDTWKAYEKGCAAYNLPLTQFLEQACLDTRACRDSSHQRMTDADEMSTAVGFLQIRCSDAAREAGEAAALAAGTDPSKATFPNFPK